MSGGGDNSTVVQRYVATAYPVEISVALLVISFVIVVENIVGVVTIRLQPSLHTTTNIFVCSMAVTNTAASMCLFCTSLFTLLHRAGTFPNVDYGPYVIRFTIGVYVCLTISMVHMTVVACERYVFIAHPFVYRRRVTRKTIRAILAGYWLLSVAYIVCIYGFNDLEELTSFFITTTVTKSKPNASYYLSSMLFFTFAILTGIPYMLIVRVAVKRNRTKLNKNANHVSQKEESCKARYKTIRFFMLIYGIFILLTLPAVLIYIVQNYVGKVPSVHLHMATLSVNLVSGIDFLVLSVLNAEFRSALNKLMTRLFCRRRNVFIE